MSEVIGTLGEEELKINTVQVAYDFYLPDDKKLTFDGLEYEEMKMIDKQLCFILIVPFLPEQVAMLFDHHVFTKVERIPYSVVDWSFSKKIYQPSTYITSPNYYWERVGEDKMKLTIVGEVHGNKTGYN